MKIHLDRDYMCPYFLVSDGKTTKRFEIGDLICIYYADDINRELNSTFSSEYAILNITSKIIVLESHGRCYYVKIEELERRIKI